jgi:DNA-binding transcriptional LysR family regulator
MHFNQVRYFLVLSETLNFTRAAQRCHVTQPTLTNAIKRLEDELGGQLVVRDGKHTRLSPLGRALRGHFEQIEQTRTIVKETASTVIRGEQIELNVGLMCTIGPRILGRFLEAFLRENPQAMLYLHDVTPEAIPELLLSGALDGAFCARHGKHHKKLDYVTLFKETMVVAFPDGHEFGRVDGVSLARVTEQPYLDRLHCEFRDELISMSGERGLTLDVVFASQREDWIQDMVRDGMGVSVIPEHSLIVPQLQQRPVVEPVLERNVEFATVHGGSMSAGLHAMVEMLRKFPWAELVTRHRKH